MHKMRSNFFVVHLLYVASFMLNIYNYFMNETLETKPRAKNNNINNNNTNMNETFENKPKAKKKFTKLILLLISYLILAVIVWKVATRQTTDPVKLQEQAQKELTAIVDSVGKIMVLPKDETPQVAIIQDVDALKKSQDFFTDAQNGDKILVYAKARKAIIYREETNQIVNVALNIGPVTDETNTTPVKEEEKAAVTSTTTKATSTSTTNDEDEQ